MGSICNPHHDWGYKVYQKPSFILGKNCVIARSSFFISWEQRKLGEVCQITMGQSPDGATYSDTPSDYILVQGNADLKDGWVFPRVWTTQKTKTADAGDLIMSVRAPAGSMGKTAYNVVLGRGVAGIKGNEFIYQSLVKMDGNGFWKRLSAGSTFESINSDIVANAAIFLPQNIDEQDLIGKYFKTLDNLITLHQRKANAQFQAIIPQKTYVKMTFSWEQRKVSEIAFRFDNLRVPVAANLRVSGNTPYYGANGIQDYVDGFTHEGEFVLVAEDGANDLKNYPVKCVNGRIWVNNHAHVLQGKPEIAVNRFLAYAISQANIEALLVGGGRAKLNAETMMGIELYIPILEEQIQIGDFLRSLDDLITLHQCKDFADEDCLGYVKGCFVIKNLAISWEQRKLGDFFEERNERSGAGELISVTIGSGIQKYAELGRFDTKPSDMSKYKRVEIGDIAYNSMRMWQGASGYSPYSGILSPAYTVIAPRNGVSSLFFSYLIKRPQLIHLFQIHSQGLTPDTWNLKYPAFSQIEASAPHERDEQERIAGVLSKVDNLITLHRCKRFQFLMNFLQPRAVQKNRCIKNAWEQRKLKDLCSMFTDGDWIESKDQSESGIRLIQTGNVGVTEFLDKPSNKKWVSFETFVRLHCTEVECGDILISRLPEPAGRACIVPNIGQKMITAVDCTIARLDTRYCNDYIVQYLSTRVYFNEVNNCLAGGTRQRISRGNLANFLIPLPTSKDEQKQIGLFLAILDNLITLHQRKREEFKEKRRWLKTQARLNFL